MSVTPTWFQVARRPKWIGAFFIAMAVAAICALLAQWQASRSFEKAVTQQQITEFKQLDEVIQPNEPAPQFAVGTQVKAPIFLGNHQIYVVANRNQSDGSKGYWLVTYGTTSNGDQLVLTLGFASTLEKAHEIKVALASRVDSLAKQNYPTLVPGVLMPSEAPELKPTDVAGTDVFNSLSLAQLANLLDETVNGSYPLFLLVSDPAFTAPGLTPIKVLPPSVEVQINWLSAFYAIEWSVFCGFAFFLWWRLVRDAQILEAEQK